MTDVDWWVENVPETWKETPVAVRYKRYTAKSHSPFRCKTSGSSVRRSASTRRERSTSHVELQLAMEVESFSSLQAGELDEERDLVAPLRTSESGKLHFGDEPVFGNVLSKSTIF